MEDEYGDIKNEGTAFVIPELQLESGAILKEGKQGAEETSRDVLSLFLFNS